MSNFEGPLSLEECFQQRLQSVFADRISITNHSEAIDFDVLLEEFVKNLVTENDLCKMRSEYYRVRSNTQEVELKRLKKEIQKLEKTNKSLSKQLQKNKHSSDEFVILEAAVENLTKKVELSEKEKQKERAINNKFVLMLKNANNELLQKEEISRHERLLLMSLQRASEQLQQRNDLYSRIIKELRKDPRIRDLMTFILERLDCDADGNTI